MAVVRGLLLSRWEIPRHFVRNTLCLLPSRSMSSSFSLAGRGPHWQAGRPQRLFAISCAAQTLGEVEPSVYHVPCTVPQMPAGTTLQEDPQEPEKRKAGRPKGFKVSDETRRKISAANLGKKRSAEARANVSASKKGVVRSAEATAKTASKLKGQQRSEDTRARMRAAHLGVKKPERVKEKIRASMLARRKASGEAPPQVRKKRIPSKPSSSARIAPPNRRIEMDPAQLRAALTEMRQLRDRLGDFLPRMEASQTDDIVRDKLQRENPQRYAVYLEYLELKDLVRRM